MPPQREIFQSRPRPRPPPPSAPCSAAVLVDRDLARRRRSRTSRTPPGRGRLLDELQARGRERVDPCTASSGSTRRWRSGRSATSGPAAARAAATRPASSPTPTFTFKQREPVSRPHSLPPRRSRPVEGRSSRRSATLGRRTVGEQLCHGLAHMCPARSHSARSIAASASGRSSTRRHASTICAPFMPPVRCPSTWS